MTMVDHKKKRWSRWAWPLGLLATGAGGAAVFLLRGCWHTRMSWPVREGDHSYQVCPECGIKRLFEFLRVVAVRPVATEFRSVPARWWHAQ